MVRINLLKPPTAPLERASLTSGLELSDGPRCWLTGEAKNCNTVADTLLGNAAIRSCPRCSRAREMNGVKLAPGDDSGCGFTPCWRPRS